MTSAKARRNRRRASRRNPAFLDAEVAIAGLPHWLRRGAPGTFPDRLRGLLPPDRDRVIAHFPVEVRASVIEHSAALRHQEHHRGSCSGLGQGVLVHRLSALPERVVAALSALGVSPLHILARIALFNLLPLRRHRNPAVRAAVEAVLPWWDRY